MEPLCGLSKTCSRGTLGNLNLCILTVSLSYRVYVASHSTNIWESISSVYSSEDFVASVEMWTLFIEVSNTPVKSFGDTVISVVRVTNELLARDWTCEILEWLSVIELHDVALDLPDNSEKERSAGLSHNTREEACCRTAKTYHSTSWSIGVC